MILVIDNYDSFTYNLVQEMGKLGADLHVIRNDECSVDEIEAMFPDIEAAVGPSDFGREALGKARKAVESTRTAISRKDTSAVKTQVEQLHRTQRMFKGVVTRVQ